MMSHLTATDELAFTRWDELRHNHLRLDVMTPRGRRWNADTATPPELIPTGGYGNGIRAGTLVRQREPLAQHDGIAIRIVPVPAVCGDGSHCDAILQYRADEAHDDRRQRIRRADLTQRQGSWSQVHTHRPAHGVRPQVKRQWRVPKAADAKTHAIARRRQRHERFTGAFSHQPYANRSAAPIESLHLRAGKRAAVAVTHNYLKGLFARTTRVRCLPTHSRWQE